MKSLLSRLPTAFLFAAFLFGCEYTDSDDYDEDEETRFENNASVRVVVTPSDDEFFDEFALDPGQRITVDRSGNRATYTYQPRDTVAANDVSEYEVVFVDTP